MRISAQLVGGDPKQLARWTYIHGKRWQCQAIGHIGESWKEKGQSKSAHRTWPAGHSVFSGRAVEFSLAVDESHGFGFQVAEKCVREDSSNSGPDASGNSSYSHSDYMAEMIWDCTAPPPTPARTVFQVECRSSPQSHWKDFEGWEAEIAGKVAKTSRIRATYQLLSEQRVGDPPAAAHPAERAF